MTARVGVETFAANLNSLSVAIRVAKLRVIRVCCCFLPLFFSGLPIAQSPIAHCQSPIAFYETAGSVKRKLGLVLLLFLPFS